MFIFLNPNIITISFISNTEAEEEEEEISGESGDEVGDEIEEPVMYVRGEGSGKASKTGNVYNIIGSFESYDDNDIIGEAIEEEVILFCGEGSGYDCDVGNNDPKTEESTSTEAPKPSTAPKPMFFFGQPGCLKLSPMKVSSPSKSKTDESGTSNFSFDDFLSGKGIAAVATNKEKEIDSTKDGESSCTQNPLNDEGSVGSGNTETQLDKSDEQDLSENKPTENSIANYTHSPTNALNSQSTTVDEIPIDKDEIDRSAVVEQNIESPTHTNNLLEKSSDTIETNCESNLATGSESKADISSISNLKEIPEIEDLKPDPVTEVSTEEHCESDSLLSKDIVKPSIDDFDEILSPESNMSDNSPPQTEDNLDVEPKSSNEALSDNLGDEKLQVQESSAAQEKLEDEKTEINEESKTETADIIEGNTDNTDCLKEQEDEAEIVNKAEIELKPTIESEVAESSEDIAESKAPSDIKNESDKEKCEAEVDERSQSESSEDLENSGDSHVETKDNIEETKESIVIHETTSNSSKTEQTTSNEILETKSSDPIVSIASDSSQVLETVSQNQDTLVTEKESLKEDTKVDLVETDHKLSENPIHSKSLEEESPVTKLISSLPPDTQNGPTDTETESTWLEEAPKSDSDQPSDASDEMGSELISEPEELSIPTDQNLKLSAVKNLDAPELLKDEDVANVVCSNASENASESESKIKDQNGPLQLEATNISQENSVVTQTDDPIEDTLVNENANPSNVEEAELDLENVRSTTPVEVSETKDILDSRISEENVTENTTTEHRIETKVYPEEADIEPIEQSSTSQIQEDEQDQQIQEDTQIQKDEPILSTVLDPALEPTVAAADPTESKCKIVGEEQATAEESTTSNLDCSKSVDLQSPSSLSIQDDTEKANLIPVEAPKKHAQRDNSPEPAIISNTTSEQNEEAIDHLEESPSVPEIKNTHNDTFLPSLTNAPEQSENKPTYTNHEKRKATELDSLHTTNESKKLCEEGEIGERSLVARQTEMDAENEVVLPTENLISNEPEALVLNQEVKLDKPDAPELNFVQSNTHPDVGHDTASVQKLQPSVEDTLINRKNAANEVQEKVSVQTALEKIQPPEISTQTEQKVALPYRPTNDKKASSSVDHLSSIFTEKEVQPTSSQSENLLQIYKKTQSKSPSPSKLTAKVAPASEKKSPLSEKVNLPSDKVTPPNDQLQNAATEKPIQKNRKRRLSGEKVRLSSESSDGDCFDTHADSSGLNATDDSADEDIGGKRLKMRARVPMRNVRKFVEQKRTTRGAEISSDEDARPLAKETLSSPEKISQQSITVASVETSNEVDPLQISTPVEVKSAISVDKPRPKITEEKDEKSGEPAPVDEKPGKFNLCIF